MKAYKDCDEWLGEIENFSLRAERMTPQEVAWAREAWKQATRTATVQQQILIGELKEVKRRLHELEDQIEDWTMEGNVRDEYGDD